MNWFQSILYGFISGLTEFIPVSSRAHQAILLEMFGQTRANPLLDFFVHIAILVGVYMSRNYRVPGEQNRGGYLSASADVRFTRTATIPMLIGIVVFTYLLKGGASLLMVSLFCLVNGIILFIPGRMLQGNKDSRSMSALDGILAGLAGALSGLTGISRTGSIVSAATARGADRNQALKWAISLSIPAMAMLILIDIFNLFTAFQAVSFWNVVFYLLAAVAAYGGTYLGIRFIKIISVRIGFSSFAYYCWGAALFSFVLYLI